MYKESRNIFEKLSTAPVHQLKHIIHSCIMKYNVRIQEAITGTTTSHFRGHYITGHFNMYVIEDNAQW